MILKVIDEPILPEEKPEGRIINPHTQVICGCNCGDRGNDYDSGYTHGIYE